MRIGQLKSMLNTQPDGRVVKFGFGVGVQEDKDLGVIYFEVVENVKISVMKKEIESWLGKLELGENVLVYFKKAGEDLDISNQSKLYEKIGDSICDFD